MKVFIISTSGGGITIVGAYLVHFIGALVFNYYDLDQGLGFSKYGPIYDSHELEENSGMVLEKKNLTRKTEGDDHWQYFCEEPKVKEPISDHGFLM